MSKKKSIQDLLEAHLDKVILGLIAVISLYLLWSLVIGNPYGVTAFGRKMGPSQIDLQNRQQARLLEELLSAPAPRIEYDQELVAEFETMLQTSLPQLAVQKAIPYPGAGEQIFDEDRLYPVPEVVGLTEVHVARIRGAVHKPTEEVTPDIPYQNVPAELADLDLVTVSGLIDVPTLYRSFEQAFMGPRLKATWKEPSFARPVFARLQLQRRHKQEDASWSDWQTVSRPRIDPFRKLMETTPLTTEAMEFGGVMLWLKQYEDPRVQLDLLQPEPYDFASTATDWLPPKYLDEAQTILKRQEEELRRQQREERLRAREAAEGGGVPGMMPGGGRPTGRDRSQPTRGTGRDTMMQGRQTDTSPLRSAAAARRERTIEDVMKDLEQERITEKTKLDSRRDPLLVWAHDDAVQPGQTYQYRIRIGVFNPIAGRNWFREDQLQYKNQVVLWSDFSGPTKPVEVPKMLHIFPLEVLAKEAGGGVKVDVARYYLGQWRTHEFDVFPGQIIGHTAEYKAPASAAPVAGDLNQPMMPDMMMGEQFGAASTAESATLQEVDFTTPFMMVDTSSTVEWSGNFSNRSEFWQMLYYNPDQTMQKIPVGRGNWPAEMRRQRDDIKDAEQKPVRLDMSRGTIPGMMPGGMPGPMAPDTPMPMAPDLLMEMF